LSISPHMHFRGKSFTAKLKTKSKSSEILLSVPKYDFNWQHIYQLSEPMPLSDIRSITADIVFDNSSANPFNPDPSKYVTWGDQTWEDSKPRLISSLRITSSGSMRTKTVRSCETSCLCPYNPAAAIHDSTPMASVDLPLPKLPSRLDSGSQERSKRQ